MKFLSALKQKKVERSFFLALLLKPYKVGVILFEKTDQTLVILATRESDLSKNINDVSGEELVGAADEVITFVEGSLPSGAQVSKTVFALPRAWQDEGKIKKEFQPRLKQLCSELSLEPIGFIVSVEAIIRALQKKDGVPISALVVEIAHTLANVYLVRSGNILQEVSGTIDKQDTAGSVEKLFTKLDAVEVLPPKILLFDYEGAKVIQQEFLSREWNKDLPFLHLPQVVILEKGFENEAVINGVAIQMDSQVTEDMQKPLQEEETYSEESETVEEPEVEVGTPEDFGFARDVDAKDVMVDSPEESDKENEEAKGEDVSSDVEKYEKVTEDDKDLPKDTLFTRLKALNPVEKIKNIKLSKKTFTGVPALVSKLSPKTWGIIVLVILALGAGIYLYYTQLLKAEIIVFADNKTIDNSSQITLSTQDDTSADSKTIHIDPITISVDGDATQNTTGQKDTGDKAKGTVTIYNKTDNPVSIGTGATVSSNDLDFTTLDDVNIASTSSFSTSFSSSDVDVQASNFGSNYNLPSGTNFTIDNQSTSAVFAKNASAFSGGTKKEVKVVSANDLSSLTDKVVQTLTQKADQQAQGRVSSDEVLLPQALSYDFTTKNFSKNEGDEASSVTLTSSINFKLGAYHKADLTQFVNQMANGQVPSDYALVGDQSDISLQNITVNKDGSATGTLNAHALFAPKLDANSLAQNISGKTVSKAEQTVRQIPGVSDVHINMSTLPLLPSWLPFNPKHITIIVRSNG